jgi:pimeloyl-ACP methyl ester carboxylesterase
VLEGADLLAWHTLRPLPEGHWTLCCHPTFEADVFRNNVDPTLLDRLRDVPVPLRIIAGDPDAAYTSPTAAIAKSARDLFGIDYTMVPGTTHFLQFEEPQACRDRLIDFLQRHGL